MVAGCIKHSQPPIDFPLLKLAMKYIETDSCKPAINLAYEDYFLKSKDLEEDIFMLWRNEPSIMVGRFQNTMEEVNTSFAEAHQIQVVRRISGGGAVYHDLGNLCFSFILHDVAPEVVDKSKYIRPLVGALAQLGIFAEVTKRNDLIVAGKKFSGTAMSLHKKRLLFHGTLLFDTDLEMLNEVLKNSEAKIVSKGVKSVRSTVTNLKDHLPIEMDILQFKENIKQLLFGDAPVLEYVPSQEDHKAIQELVKTKYEAWKWNFGGNPNSLIQRSCQFPEGNLEISLELEKGHIKACHIKSDFGMPLGTEEIKKRLENIRYISTDVENALSGFDPESNLGSISKDDLVQLIIRS